MTTDFFYAFITGLSFLLLFWSITLIFIFFRKPPKSKLSMKLTLWSLFPFMLSYLVIFIFM